MRQGHFLSLLSLLATGASAAPSQGKVPKGFVTTDGNHFKLDGKDFYFAGSNAYYFPFNVSTTLHSSIQPSTCLTPSYLRPC